MTLQNSRNCGLRPLTDEWHWMKSNRAQRTRCAAPSTACATVPTSPLVDAATLEALAAGAVHFSLPAGSLLFESGSAPDGVYLLASGRLGVKTPGMARLTAEIERSELVGEAGWLLKEQRSAAVFAMRDSELLLLPTPAARCPRRSIDPFLAGARPSLRPSAAVQQSTCNGEKKPAHVFVIVPNSVEVDVANFATPPGCGIRARRPHGAGLGRAGQHPHGALVQRHRGVE